ncbi:MAG: fumarylacetoacetate hydrolase family protein [Planctomycetota bacterium]
MNHDFEWPESLAWFSHRVEGRCHLGIADPATHTVRDAGAFDPDVELAAERLTTASLRTRLNSATHLDLDAIDWLPPLPSPSKILCFGKNFAAHAAEFGAEVPSEPMWFGKLVDTVIAHGEPIELPHWVSTRIDHEAELGVVLGFDDPECRGIRNVPEDRALELVAGYTQLNDVTARRMQGDDRSQQKPWIRCKSFDTFCPLGPFVIPSDAFEPGCRRLTCLVDEDLRQDSTLDKMVVDVATGISWLSRHTTLRPGDLIAMGTPEGVGPLQPENRCSVWIEGLGRLSNPIVRGADAPMRPGLPRPR